MIKPVRVLQLEKLKSIIIVGVGGTGGYLLQQLARLLYGLKEQGNSVPSVLLIDGDLVESKNLRRQYFLPQDIGKNKASVLAERYSRAYGLDIGAYPHYLAEETDFRRIFEMNHYSSTQSVTDPYVWIGCVDNAATRKLIHERLHQHFSNVVYIDSGNGSVTVPNDNEHVDRYQLAHHKNQGWEGQVVVGVRINGEDRLPFPGEVFPDLLEAESPEDRLPSEIPCGEVVVSNPQRLMTNLMAATSILMYLHTLLLDGTILLHRTFFDARKGYIRSDSAIDNVLEVAL